MNMPPVKRVLLKLSGEVLMGGQQFGIDPATVAARARDVKAAKDTGLEVCLVIGGGNIFRGMAGAAQGMDRAQADYMGMLATVMNALAMQNALEQLGVNTRVQSAVQMDQVCEPVIRRRAERHLEKGRVVIFAAGVGSPYFTTDSGAALRAAEMNCDALQRNLKVMDATAFAHCRENKMGIVVFELARRGNIQRVVCGEPVGTIVRDNVETRAF